MFAVIWLATLKLCAPSPGIHTHPFDVIDSHFSRQPLRQVLAEEGSRARRGAFLLLLLLLSFEFSSFKSWMFCSMARTSSERVAGGIKSAEEKMRSFEACACLSENPLPSPLPLPFLDSSNTGTFRRRATAHYFKSGIVFIVSVSLQYFLRIERWTFEPVNFSEKEWNFSHSSAYPSRPFSKPCNKDTLLMWTESRTGV